MMRRLAQNLWLLMLLLAVSVVLSAPWWARWVSGKNFAIHAIAVTAPYRNVTEQQIAAAISPELAQGLLLLDLRRVRERLLENPWVARADVRKVWPNRLELTVFEHEPIARWGDVGLLTASGDYFELSAAAEMRSLARLSGPTAKRAEILAFYQKADPALRSLSLHITRADFSSRGGLQVKLSSGVQVLVGREDIDARWQRLMTALPTLLADASKAKSMASIDLRYTNGFAVRVHPSIEPQSTPGTPVAPDRAAPAAPTRALRDVAILMGTH